MSGLYDQPVLVIDPGTHTAPIECAAADREGRWAVTGSYDKTVRIWSLGDGGLLRTIRLPAGPGHIGKVYTVAINADGSLIAAGGWTSDPEELAKIYLFDRATGALMRRIDGLPTCVMHLAFSHDGRRLAAGLGGGGLRIYAAEHDWAEVARDEHYRSAIYGASFASDGRLATTSLDGNVRLYAANLAGVVRPDSIAKAPSGNQPSGIAFSSNGTLN